MSHRRVLHPCLVAALGLAPLATAMAQRQRADLERVRSQLLGCYIVERGAWSASLPTNAPGAYDIPPMIRLDSAHTDANTWPDTANRRAYPSIAGVDGSTRPREGSWFVADDSLSVSWSDGHVSAYFAVVVRADSLRGVATAGIHAMRGVRPTAPVLLRRVSCTQFNGAPSKIHKNLLLANQALLLANAGFRTRPARSARWPHLLLSVRSRTPSR